MTTTQDTTAAIKAAMKRAGCPLSIDQQMVMAANLVERRDDHVQDQLCARIDELEREKQELLDENDQLYADTMKEMEAVKAERDALAKRLDDEGVSHDNTIAQRDYAEEMADKLSLAICGITRRDIGEHSSAHCPWSTALDHAEELAAYAQRQRDAFLEIFEYWNGGEGLAAEDAAQHAQDVARGMLDETPEPHSHPDEIAVTRFAEAMRKKMAVSREKGRSGWGDPQLCSAEDLSGMLIAHLAKGNPGTFEDVANFAMMLHQRGEDPQVLAISLDRLITEKKALLGPRRSPKETGSWGYS